MTPRAGRRRIVLMRHGHVDYFAPGLTDPREAVLTEIGEAQAAAAAEALAPLTFDIAVCSGLKRTRRTAEIVLAQNAAPPPLEDEFGLEELKSGRFYPAKSRDELAARLAFSFDDAEAPGATFLPEGELFAEAEARIVTALETLCTQRDWRQALIVAHEGVNRIILGWASGGGLKTIAAFEQDLSCVNVLDLDVVPDEAGALRIERVIVKSMNVTPYDLAKHGLPRTALEHLFDVDFGGVRPRETGAP